MKRVRFYLPRRCELCNKPFRAARKDAKYCSPACRKVVSRAGRSKSPKPVTGVTIKQLELLLVENAGKL